MKTIKTIARMIFRAVEMCILECFELVDFAVLVAEVEEVVLEDVVDVECEVDVVECEVEWEVVDVVFEVVARGLSSARWRVAGMVWSVVGTGRGFALAKSVWRDTQGAGIVVRVLGREVRVEGQHNVERTEVVDRRAWTAMKFEGHESPGPRVDEMSASIVIVAGHSSLGGC